MNRYRDLSRHHVVTGDENVIERPCCFTRHEWGRKLIVDRLRKRQLKEKNEGRMFTLWEIDN